ncbi:MAG: hypothetical protein GC165_18955 [Armatimonadetes bacterium]|nr:hypothetical protein [Armatimonadota bacterium]
MGRLALSVLLISSLCGCGRSRPIDAKADSKPVFDMSSNKEDHVWPGMADRVDVIGEEKGELAADIERRLTPIFVKKPNIKAAYLVHVRYNEREESVACAIDLGGGKTDKDLREAVSRAFRQTNHRKGTVLDIFAAEGEMLSNLTSKAKPFYRKQG